jgi:general stress protein CsbA
VRNYLSWAVAFLAVLVALVVIGASTSEWAMFVGVAVIVAGWLVAQGILRRARRPRS